MHTQESMIESEAEARNDCRNQTLSYIDRVVSQVNLLLALDSLFEVAKTTESREYNDVCLCCHSHMSNIRIWEWYSGKHSGKEKIISSGQYIWNLSEEDQEIIIMRCKQKARKEH